jgi:hypothetical protein
MVPETSLPKALKSHRAGEKNVGCDLLCTADRENRGKGDVGRLVARQSPLGHRTAR